MKSLLVMTFLFLSASAQALSFSSNGSEGVGGGDEIGIEFRAIAQLALNRLPRLPNKQQQNLVDEALRTARIVAVDDNLDLMFEKQIQISAALNFPQKGLILVNRKRWSEIQDVTVKQILAAHEIYGLALVEGTGDYRYSSKLKRDDAYQDYLTLANFLNGFESDGSGSTGPCRTSFMLVPGVNGSSFDRQYDSLRVKLDLDYSYVARRYMAVGDQAVKVLRAGNEIVMVGNADMGDFTIKVTRDSSNSLVIEGRWREFDVVNFEGGTCRLKMRRE